MDHSCHYTAVMVLLIFFDVFADSVRALPSGRMMGDCGGQSFLAIISRVAAGRIFLAPVFRLYLR